MLLLFATLSGFSAHAAEASCPNIYGTYYTGGEQIHFDQSGCEHLTRYSSLRETRGEMVYGVIRSFKLDGTPFLFDGKRGESAKLVGDTFEFTFNFQGGHRYVIPHGFCKVPKMTVKKASNGNLEVQYQAQNCEDGFTGEVNARWIRIGS